MIKKNKKSKVLMKNGFTLIEMLITITIVGILAAVAIASMYTSRAKSNYASFKTTVASIKPQALFCVNSSKSLNTPVTPNVTEICNLTTGADAVWPNLPTACTDAGYSGITSNPAIGTFSFTATCVTGSCAMTCTNNGCTPSNC
jgi:prepilin-type N-terminal cleavage/methylation domain-containing protein